MRINLLTVCFFSQEFLQLGMKIFRQLNPIVDFNWHVIDNSFFKFYPEGLKGFQVHNGIKQRVEPLRYGKTKIGSGSVHHGDALNIGLQYLEKDADLWIIIDPDFFLLVPLEELTDYFFKKDLWFYGADYSNTKKALIKDFPCAFFMMINPKYVKSEDLDFSPGYIGEEREYYPDVGYKVSYKFRQLPDCKYEIFPKQDNNIYYIDKEIIGIHSRAKMDKLKKFNHGRPPEDVQYKYKLDEVRNMYRERNKRNVQT